MSTFDLGRGPSFIHEAGAGPHAPVRLFRAPIVVLDTETTGIIRRDPWAECVELGAVALDCCGVETSRFRSFVLPNVLDERAAPALAINHITPDMLTSAPRPREVAEAFRAWVLATGASYVTAFNVGFDQPVVEKMTLAGLSWARCVMLAASDIMGPAGELPPSRFGSGWQWCRLSHAATYFGVTVVGDAHRAETDARTAGGVACAIRLAEIRRAQA